MGAVYEATHTKLDQRVAIKILLPDFTNVPELRARFEREARASAKLRHRNSARVIDVDQTEEGAPYFVMELLQGHDLESELEARGPLPPSEAAYFVLQAAAAMIEAHEHGIVHRDLKPSNLFLHGEVDGSVCLKVLDFGISKVSTDDVRVTSTQTQMGTPLYMSPEQVRSAKNVDARTDIWSLGVILYELLSGKPPFVGTAAGIGAAIVSDEPQPLREIRPEVSADLAAIVSRAMQKDPSMRFATMRELANALASFSSAPVAIAQSYPKLDVATKASIGDAPTIAAVPPDAKATAGNWTHSSEARSSRVRPWMFGILALPVIGVALWIATHRSQPPVIADAPTRSTTTSAPPVPSDIASVVPVPSSAPPAASSAPAIATSRVSRPRPSATKNPDRL